MWIYPKAQQVVIQGEENLGRYRFGTMAMAKTFCKKCGVNLTNVAMDLSDEEIEALPDAFRGMFAHTKLLCPLNLRTLNDFHISEIKDPEKTTKGAEFGEKYVNP